MRCAFWFLLASCRTPDETPGPARETDDTASRPATADSGSPPGVATGPPAPGEVRAAALAEASVAGDEADDRLGDNLVGAGDVNGDGLADLWIGAKGAGETAGLACLFLGPLFGPHTLAEADATFTGEQVGDFAGGGLAGPGDVNGDGVPDLLAGAKLSDRGGADTGAAFLLLGPVAGSQSLASASAVFAGELSGDEAGGSVAGAGDLDGDGAADLLIAAAGADVGGAGSGAVYVVVAPPLGETSLGAYPRIDGNAAGDTTGGNLAALGDTDGDGRDDFAIAAGGADPFGVPVAGQVTIFTHLPTGIAPLTSGDARLHGTVPLQALGAVAGPGDLDDDGYAEVLVGAPGDSTGGFIAGSAFLFRGPLVGDAPLSSATTTLQGAGGDAAGFAVARGGDLDADGTLDVLIGAPGGATRPGTAWWVSGHTVGVHALADVGGGLLGAEPGDVNSHALAGLGDTNGDGADDFASGAWEAGLGGAVYLVFGGPG